MGGKNSVQDRSDKPVVVIVGGGVGGITVAKQLDASGLFNVILLERKEYFLWNIGTLRTSVDREHSKKIIIPYSNLLKNGAVLKAEVESVSKEGVKVYGRDELVRYDYLVIATGSSYAFPGRIPEPEAEKAVAKYQQFFDIVKEAQRILIVGGGPVGIELAGEITHVYKDAKHVTLLSSSETLLPNPGHLSDKLRDFLRTELESVGVEVILGDKVSKLQEEKDSEEKKELGSDAPIFSNAVLGKRTVVTDKGKSIETDLVLFCTGAKSNSAVFENTSEFKMDDRRRIRTNENMQVEGTWNVFAVGDCRADNAGVSMLAEKEANIAAKNIIAIQKGSLKQGDVLPQALTAAENKAPGMLVPIGPKRGGGEMGGSFLGNWITSKIKGNGLFISRAWGILNQKLPKDVEDVNISSIKSTELGGEARARNVSAALQISPEAAEELWSKGGLPSRAFEETEQHT